MKTSGLRAPGQNYPYKNKHTKQHTQTQNTMTQQTCRQHFCMCFNLFKKQPCKLYYIVLQLTYLRTFYSKAIQYFEKKMQLNERVRELMSPLSNQIIHRSSYKLKRCSNKECCKQCRYVKFKGTMTK